VPGNSPSDTSCSQLRLAELIAALSLGVDLGFGQPMEHVLRQCRIALQIAELVGVDVETRSSIYYSALLVNVGCHTDAHEQAYWFGDDIGMKATKYDAEPFSAADVVTMLRMLGAGGTPLHRLRVGFDFAISGRKELDGMITRHAELARALGAELGLGDDVLAALGSSYERWDGKGFPGDLSAGAIPLASRIAQLAEFLEVEHRTDGVEAALVLARRRSGRQFDPTLVDVVCADAEKVFNDLDDLASWDAVIDGEPGLARTLSSSECEDALSAVGRFVDLKSPYTVGHSPAVAALAQAAAVELGLDEADRRVVHRAALVAGFGRLGVSNAIWDKAGPLTAGEWERARLHPQYTDRMLHRSSALAPIGRVAGQIRERLDGTGYPSGVDGSAIGRPSRIVATADAFQSMREPRPHRPAMSVEDATRSLRDEARRGRLDPTVVDAVLTAAGLRVRRRRDGPGGLTAREVEVLQCLARGMSNKEIAKRLVISPKTVGNHIEHVYTKIGANNRAAASLYAVRHGLLPEDD
jgi:HD-GYP domain-containing protein (c-di-GMP phosphodiesterase class II)/DNA-binding CsgD family transcriptional regulator